MFTVWNIHVGGMYVIRWFYFVFDVSFYIVKLLCRRTYYLYIFKNEYFNVEMLFFFVSQILVNGNWQVLIRIVV